MQQKNVTLLALLDALSHDLKSPLASIQSITAIIALKKETLQPTELTTYLSRIEDKTLLANENIDALLHTVALGEHTLPLTYEFFDVTEVVPACVSIAQKRTTHSFTQTYNSKPVVIMADKEKFQLLITTLLDHCARFVQAESALSISTETKKNSCVITLKYTGQPLLELEKNAVTLENFLPQISKTVRLSLFVALELIKAQKGRTTFATKEQTQQITISFPLKV
jgi:K+-sensing histidine kinase KdpD